MRVHVWNILLASGLIAGVVLLVRPGDRKRVTYFREIDTAERVFAVCSPVNGRKSGVNVIECQGITYSVVYL